MSADASAASDGPGNEIGLGPADVFPVDRLTIVAVGSREIGVLRRGDGRIYAVRNRCPHKGAPLCRGRVGGTMLPGVPDALDYGLAPMVVRCPWHGYEFDIASGRGLFANTAMRLRTYPVRVRDGCAWLSLSKGDTA